MVQIYHGVAKLFPEMNFLDINSVVIQTHILFTNVRVSGLCFEMNVNMQCIWLRTATFGSFINRMANGTML